MRTLLPLAGFLGAALALVFVANRVFDPSSTPDAPGVPLPSVEELDWQAQTAGEPAPPFALPPIGGGADVTLAQFRGRPVVLVFGSFTCNMFCGYLRPVGEMARAYEGRVPFVFVYVRDAGHPPPPDGPLGRYNMQLPEPDRRGLIEDIWNETGLPIRCLYGGDGPVSKAYRAFPLRLMVIDAAGRIAFDAGNGLRGGWDYVRVRRFLDTATRVGGAE